MYCAQARARADALKGPCRGRSAAPRTRAQLATPGLISNWQYNFANGRVPAAGRRGRRLRHASTSAAPLPDMSLPRAVAA